MTKSVAKQYDQLVASELDLALSPDSLILKKLVTMLDLEAFVFMFIKDGLVHIDTVDTWSHVNGKRLKLRTFATCNEIETRLSKRMYKRWYVREKGVLFPLQTSKVEDLKSIFNFVIDDNPLRQTLIVVPEDAPIVRKVKKCRTNLFLDLGEPSKVIKPTKRPS